MATPFSTDTDLQKKRPNILALGVANFDSQHEEASRIIERSLTQWYNNKAVLHGVDPQDAPFNRSLLLKADVEVLPAAVLLTLSLVYDLLAKDLPPEEDGMASQRDEYKKQFDREWETASYIGFSYDWDKSGSIDPDESPTAFRSLIRQ